MKVSNPLTIIAMFSGAAEVFATGALVALPQEIQAQFVYFVMLFPVLLVLIFFSILVCKPQVLYAPSDYDNQEHFLDANNLKDVITEEAEKVISDITRPGDSFETKALSKQVANSTIARLGKDVMEQIITYMQTRPDEAFTARGLGHIVNCHARTVQAYLHVLAERGLITYGKDGDTTVWQIKT
ncbi:hypothetical protein GCM10011369_18710 [Neiella marina]|uniref:Uncharacterized protein n=1 Tax=Neiella marina TaxID=508461 RepID=A0A8J2U522_9GAMM|nr:hypothetical protein [Neiella marina]GGA77065.1 hypothetical protein GCM10011369_18710 [Neiella marina]